VKAAVSWCIPTLNCEVDPHAVPLETGTRLLGSAVPLLNCALPAAAGRVIVVVSVTGTPMRTGEAGEVVNLVLVRTVSSGGVVSGFPFRSSNYPLAKLVRLESWVSLKIKNLPGSADAAPAQQTTWHEPVLTSSAYLPERNRSDMRASSPRTRLAQQVTTRFRASTVRKRRHALSEGLVRHWLGQTRLTRPNRRVGDLHADPLRPTTAS
jgi:hypothetical protein